MCPRKRSGHQDRCTAQQTRTYVPAQALRAPRYMHCSADTHVCPCERSELIGPSRASMRAPSDAPAHAPGRWSSIHPNAPSRIPAPSTPAAPLSESCSVQVVQFCHPTTAWARQAPRKNKAPGVRLVLPTAACMRRVASSPSTLTHSAQPRWPLPVWTPPPKFLTTRPIGSWRRWRATQSASQVRGGHSLCACACGCVCACVCACA